MTTDLMVPYTIDEYRKASQKQKDLYWEWRKNVKVVDKEVLLRIEKLRPDIKREKNLRDAAYRSRPDVKAKKAEYYARPDVKAKLAAYRSRYRSKKSAYDKMRLDKKKLVEGVL